MFSERTTLWLGTVIRRGKPLVGPALSVAVFLSTAPFAVFDFDPHHDGNLLEAAIGVQEGKALFKEVLTQYGPVTTWYLSLWVGVLPEHPAVALRASHLAMVLFTGLFLGDLGRVAPRSLRLTSGTTWSLSTVWLLTNDVFYGVAMLPWPSMVASFLTTAITYFVALAWSAKGRSPGISNMSLGLCSSLLNTNLSNPEF